LPAAPVVAFLDNEAMADDRRLEEERIQRVEAWRSKNQGHRTPYRRI
jgi:hypothetical protein